MAKNILFLIHGMGRNFAEARGDEAAWSDEVIEALDAAWTSFPTLSGIPREDVLELVPITYDHVFREYLNDVSDAASRVGRYLPQGVLREVFSILESASEEEKNFFWDHISDVLDYRYGADRHRLVHLEIALAIVKKREEVLSRPDHQNATFSILCHSLGTATTHGAINRLGGGNIGDSAAYRLGGDFRLRTYMTLANVSRILWYGEQDIYRSTIVRPFTVDQGPGYVDHLINVSHVLDPIPAPHRFDPPAWGNAYQTLAIQHLRSLDVHGFAHYLAHPRVSGALFRSILSDAFLSHRDIEAVASRFADIETEDAARRERSEALIASLSASIRQAYRHDRSVVTSTAGLVARSVRDLWKHRQAVKELLAS